MDALITQLIEVLQLELAAYQKFYNLLEEERDILIKSREKDISENTKEKEKMISHIDEMELERKLVIQEIELNCDIPSTNLRLKELIPELPEEYRSSLLFIREQLSTVIENIKRQNEANGELTVSALKFIDMNIKLLMGDVDKGVELYDDTSKKKKHPDSIRRVLDCKI